MRLTCAQLDVESGDVKSNVRRAERAIDRAAAEGSDLVVLPEVFTVGYFAFDAYARRAESLAGPTLTRLSERAAERGVALLAGTLVEDLAATARETDVDTPDGEGLANTAVLFDADGERRAVYRKHHLFGYKSAEAELLTPGESLGVAELTTGGESWTVGVTTCYDLRFPELYRALAEAGCELVCVPSAWPYPRVEHWKLLPRARAIENLCYVAAANGAGTFEEATLLGRSAVYDPWGNTLASTGEGAATVTATLDPGEVERVREEFPAWEDRRTGY
jgi:predicted amidohydrolase